MEAVNEEDDEDMNMEKKEKMENLNKFVISNLNLKANKHKERKLKEEAILTPEEEKDLQDLE